MLIWGNLSGEWGFSCLFIIKDLFIAVLVPSLRCTGFSLLLYVGFLVASGGYLQLWCAVSHRQLLCFEHRF